MDHLSEQEQMEAAIAASLAAAEPPPPPDEDEQLAAALAASLAVSQKVPQEAVPPAVLAAAAPAEVCFEITGGAAAILKAEKDAKRKKRRGGKKGKDAEEAKEEVKEAEPEKDEASEYVERVANKLRRMMRKRIKETGGDAREVFRHFDQTSFDSRLSREEFTTGLERLGFGLSGVEISLLLDKFDENNDGQISYREFTEFLKPPAPDPAELAADPRAD